MKLEKGWYVLYVKTKHERKISEAITELGIETYLPMKTTLRKWSDRTKKITVPLFSNYLFVNVQSPNDFYHSLNVTNAFCYLRFGSKYARVREEEIRKIKYFLSNNEISDIDTTEKVPVVGEKVNIQYGPLEGLECEIISVNNTKKILVRIESIQKNIMATLPASYLVSMDQVG